MGISDNNQDKEKIEYENAEKKEHDAEISSPDELKAEEEELLPPPKWDWLIITLAAYRAFGPVFIMFILLLLFGIFLLWGGVLLAG